MIENKRCADYYVNSQIMRLRVYDRFTPSSKPESVHLEQGKHETAFRTALAAYRAELNIEKSLSEFNDNINYLIDLVGVLQSELGDMKEHFTTYINLNILFGIATSSIAVDLLFSSKTTLDLVIHVNASIITIAPLIYAMFMGATSESSVSHNSVVISRTPIYNIAHTDLPFSACNKVSPSLSSFNAIDD